MPGKTGLSARLLAYVTANPGKRARDLGKALGFNHLDGMLSYMTKTRMLFLSGPKYWGRYYVTQADADANADRIAALAAATRRRKIKATQQRRVEKLRAQKAPEVAARAEAKARIALAKQMLGDDAKRVLIPPTVKVTIAPTPRGRFEPAPGFVGAISSDYVLHRQGQRLEVRV
jgi:hypothetical protein